MPRFVALLRAINVGGHTVRMAELVTQFEALGFTGVSTYIASGNVLFAASARTAAPLEHRIAAALEASLGYAVATFVRTPSELAAIAAHRPFPALSPTDALHVGFLSRALTAADADRITASFGGPSDEFAVEGRELFWRRRGRVSESDFSLKRFEAMIGGSATFRSITTVRALAQRAAP